MSNEHPPTLGEPEEHRLVGSRLREAREVVGLTQADVAAALGLPRTSVLSMESGQRKVTGLELRRLSRLYRRPVSWLLGEDDEPDAAADALYRATADLTPEDKEQVLRFAQFLAGANPTTNAHARRQEAPPRAAPPGRSRRAH